MNWLGRLFHKSRLETQLDRELQFHIEQQIAAYIAGGVAPDEARRRAQLEFGGFERVKEEVRDTRWETHLDNLTRDLRYASRNLRKDKRFSLVAIFALALGIGASTIVFSVVYNAIFRALPYKNFQRSVVLRIHNLANAGEYEGRHYFSPSEFRALRDQNHVFEEVTEYANIRPQVNDGKSASYCRPEQLQFFVAVTLLTLMLARKMPGGLLTMAWGIEGVLIFLFALAVKERSFRLSGLVLLLICVAKVMVMDAWGLQTRDRYLTFIIVGAALVAVSMLYTRYRDTFRQYL